jgi:hypothetical protein
MRKCLNQNVLRNNLRKTLYQYCFQSCSQALRGNKIGMRYALIERQTRLNPYLLQMVKRSSRFDLLEQFLSGQGVFKSAG